MCLLSTTYKYHYTKLYVIYNIFIWIIIIFCIIYIIRSLDTIYRNNNNNIIFFTRSRSIDHRLSV